MKPDIGAAVHLVNGQINHLEQLALSLWYQAEDETNLAAQTKILDEYEACRVLKAQYEELLRRASK